MAEHTIGLLLGTEEDWPAAYEALVTRLGSVDGHTLRTERILNEPFDLRYKPRYSLVIDRLAWWYDLPRAWLKKVSLMDDVYLLNNPFTFQAMEKHSAYCALMRLGIRVPDTWLIPHKVPPANERFEPTAERYNAPFDLRAIGGHIGYPLFMKPFDGGQWIGVSRVGTPEELRARYDESGQRMMHLQSALEDFDVFVRSLSIGAETMSMWFDPTKPMYDRYQVKHDFLSPELGDEIVSIARLVNAFFRWEFNSCETIVKDGVAYPIDYANASPDVALTSLHYYFPWAIRRSYAGRRSARSRGARCTSTRTRARTSTGATATICHTRRSSRSTASSPTCTSRWTPTGSSATRTSRTSTRSRTTGSRRPTSIACSSTPSARRSRRTSKSISSRTTVACSARGRTTTLRRRRSAQVLETRDRGVERAFRRIHP